MRLLILLLMLCFGGATSATEWTDEQKKIIEVNEYVPLALKQDGFDAYADLFHPDYTNWYMGSDTVRDRETFLAAAASIT